MVSCIAKIISPYWGFNIGFSYTNLSCLGSLYYQPIRYNRNRENRNGFMFIGNKFEYNLLDTGHSLDCFIDFEGPKEKNKYLKELFK